MLTDEADKSVVVCDEGSENSFDGTAFPLRNSGNYSLAAILSKYAEPLRLTYMEDTASRTCLLRSYHAIGRKPSWTTAAEYGCRFNTTRELMRRIKRRELEPSVTHKKRDTYSCLVGQR
jgi:hypothetical protein